MIPRIVSGHGYLSSPAARNVLQSIPEHKTYDKQSLSCGGPGLEYDSVGSYKHGMCGNKYTDAVQNWNIPGRLGTQYNNLIGSSLPVTVTITAHHLGYFKFDLCETPNITELCFAKNRLKRAGCKTGDCTKFWKPLLPGELSSFSLNSLKGQKPLVVSLPSLSTIQEVLYHMNVQLPPGIKCRNCVLRWNYYTTNSCIGVGGRGVVDVSEEFWNCADISINIVTLKPITFNNTEKHHYLAKIASINKASSQYVKYHMAQYCPIIPAPVSVKRYTYVTTNSGQAMRYAIIK